MSALRFNPADRRNFFPMPIWRIAPDLIRLAKRFALTRIAGAGHYSSTFSAAGIAWRRLLPTPHLRIDPAQSPVGGPRRFVLKQGARGHRALIRPGRSRLLCALQAGQFYEARRLVRRPTPDMKKIPGIDFSSGSLGHGLSVALGMARGRAHGGAATTRTYCMLGDGELNEGQIWEAAMAAGHFKLQGLVGIVDRNQLSIDGPTEKVMSVEPLVDRFTSFGWDVQAHQTVMTCRRSWRRSGRLKPAGEGKPQMIIADTIKGRGGEVHGAVARLACRQSGWRDYDDAWSEIEAGAEASRDGEGTMSAAGQDQEHALSLRRTTNCA